MFGYQFGGKYFNFFNILNFFLISVNKVLNLYIFSHFRLGLSWLSSRMISSQPPMSSILESLKASAMGIGGADCKAMYPNCNIDIQLNERKLVRKRRESEKYDLKMEYM